MEKSDIVIGVVGLVLVVSMILGVPYGTYRLGRTWERRALTKALTDTLDGTCNECYNEGGKIGYKQGKVAGLKFCDDVLGNLDDGGHR